ncbi:hypothetical protein [Thermosulfurimonas sp. F29]|uniref:hypothetical protein n=1 Tax=Thermosulfurimonas sp. F29 TaxID=2867247 RepID=UPI001C82DD18|nr:hypothetical protein [Thermosulfurimonas sp. F29]MBX6423275.1 hypothetical protein [Thermosulfurimonas sp. F29]
MAPRAFAQVGFGVPSVLDFEALNAQAFPMGVDKCGLWIKIDAVMCDFDPGTDLEDFFNETLYQQNIPFVWIYKNGTKIAEIKLSEFDPYRGLSGRCQQPPFDFKFYQPILTAGEYAHIKIKLDPLDRIPEGAFSNGQRVKFEYSENNNEKEVFIGCRDLKIEKVKCPPGRIFVRGDVSVSAKVTDFHADPDPRVRGAYTDRVYVKMVLFNESLGHYTYKDILDQKNIYLHYGESKVVELKGRIPLDISSGSYSLKVILEEPRDRDRSNNSFKCPVIIEPTAVEQMEQRIREGRVPIVHPGGERAARVAQAAFPDLTVREVTRVRECEYEITIKNLGAPLQDSIYSSNPVILRVRESKFPYKALANFRLNQVDPAKRLKTTNGEVSFTWRVPRNLMPLDKDLTFMVDPDRKIAERNERNNALAKHIVCRGKGSAPSPVKGSRKPPVKRLLLPGGKR